MKEVYFQSILIADLQKNAARFQTFSKGLNVVTSTNNHVGKSSLLKSLYYALGADVDFDSVWDRNSKLYVATICIDDEVYRIARFMRRFAVFHNNKLLSITESVSNELAPLLGGIFDFAVYLPNKDTGRVEMAPPTFTFMPYYIDQDKGWTGLYNSFASIQRYKSADRIKSLYYHLNIYTKGTVELMARRDKLKERLEELRSENIRLYTILTALQEETQNLPPADTVQELEAQLEIPQKRIGKLVKQAGKVRNDIQAYEADIIQHRHRLEIISEYHAIKGNYTNQHKSENLHACPNCGYVFDEELFNIVSDNYSAANEGYLCQQIQLIIDSIAKKLSEAKELYVSLIEKLKQEEIAFSSEENEFDIYVRQRGLQDSIRRFTDKLGRIAVKDTEISAEIKEIQKEINKLPNKKEVEEKYIEYVRSNIISLDAWDPAFDGTIRLLKPIKAQGTLENKIILAQCVGLFQTMDYFKSSATRFPFVVDSPRGKEASTLSSKEILEMIVQLKMLPQTILATIDYSAVQLEIDTPANIIVLSEQRKLLRTQDYIDNEAEITSLIEILKST